jgi:23S rRNA (cytidine1920-2'-O)/16S rRNA (cytidine1409-2'-O)-methyltransferase
VADTRRLDLRLVAEGLAPSREKAQALVMAGRVRVDGRPAGKPGQAVPAGAALEVTPGPGHVGRGALKLEGALDRLAVDPAGSTAVDVGASTGGFTEVLLARGARHVYAVDVGRGQLHEALRGDPRVTVRERLNARDLSPAQVPEPCALATVDVSFISVSKLLAPLRTVLAPAADVLVLVKPQFEVGRRQVGRGGIVRDPALHRQAVEQVAEAAAAAGYGVASGCPSPVAGAEGNREFFLKLRNGVPGLDASARRALAERMVGP